MLGSRFRPLTLTLTAPKSRSLTLTRRAFCGGCSTPRGRPSSSVTARSGSPDPYPNPNPNPNPNPSPNPNLIPDPNPTSSVVSEAVGKPVNPSNLPRDWRAQTKLILSDLHARGIRHNDIWRVGRLDKNSLVPWVA